MSETKYLYIRHRI